MPEPAIPYPTGTHITVFRDDGKWGDMPWWRRGAAELKSLLVCRITLAHYDGEDEPAYSWSEWVEEADQLVREYPDCVFVY